MLASALTTLTLATAFVGMVVSNALGMEVVMVVGVRMVMFVRMGMRMGVGNTVMGVLMGVCMLVVMSVTTNMIVVQVHKDTPLHFNCIITKKCSVVKRTFVKKRKNFSLIQARQRKVMWGQPLLPPQDNLC